MSRSEEKYDSFPLESLMCVLTVNHGILQNDGLPEILDGKASWDARVRFMQSPHCRNKKLRSR